ncbi:YhdP family protein [Thiorhodococcus fuscus]|uniref:YhdP family protein n=1 Tax=Thiorhodococcus fuscus TaxID=527200 RepID=A0ABW4YDI2_9GAMM
MKRLPAFLLRFGGISAVVLALILTVLNLLAPLAADYADTLAGHLSQRLGYQIRIGGMGVSFFGTRPRLVLKQVRFSDRETGAVVLALRAMELDLDALGSIRASVPRIGTLTLVGARLRVERMPDGRFELAGLGALGGTDPKALERFLDQGALTLVDSEVLIEDADSHARVLRLRETRLDLRNVGQRHFAELSANLAPPRPLAGTSGRGDRAGEPRRDEGDRLHLIAELNGPPSKFRAWSGRLYVRFDGADLGRLLPPSLTHGYRLDTERISLESWSRIDSGRLVQSLVRADVAGVLLHANVGDASQESLAVAHARLLARLQRIDGAWRLELSDLNARVAGAELSGVRADLDLSDSGRLDRLAVSGARLDLSALTGILGAGPWGRSKPVVDLLAARPQGQVNALAVRAERDLVGQWGWSASGSVRDLAVEQHARLPGFKGLNADFAANASGGELRFGSLGLDLDLNPLFTLPLHLNGASGRLGWRRDPGGDLAVSVRTASLETDDLAGRLRLALDIPADGTSPFLDLRANFSGDASNVRPYLPAGIIHEHLLQWLEHSIVSGWLAQGDASFRGRLADFPFREHQGRFELLLDFEDLLLDYQDGWPPIRSAAGYLRFLDQGLSIQVDRGRIYDSAFSAGRAEIPDLWGPDVLPIHGEAEGPFVDARRVLIETPLASDLGNLGKALTVSGRSHLALDIDLPLVESGTLGVSGSLTWPGPATLDIAGGPIALSRLRGVLRFTENSLSADDLQARLWGRPVKLSIETRGAGDPNRSETLIEATSRAQVADLARRFPSPLWRDLSGELDWNLGVTLQNRHVKQGDLPLDFRLSSNLRGLGIDLPSPLGKAAKRTRELLLQGTLVPGRSLALDGRIQGLAANLDLDLKGGSLRLVSGRLRFGADRAPPPETDGLFLDGALGDLDLQAWTRALRLRFPSRSKGSDIALSGAQLQIERLHLGDLQLSHLSLGANPRDDGWHLKLGSDELDGRVVVPKTGAEQPLLIRLDRLDLSALVAQGGSAAGSSKRADDPHLSDLPSLDLGVRDLLWHGASLGTLGLDLRRNAEGIDLPNLSLDGKVLTLKGSGDWRSSGDGGRSRIGLVLNTPDLGALFKTLDARSTLEAGRSSARLKLDWPGAPETFSLPKAKGEIDLQVGKGRFLAVEPGVGRILGFLNFSALGRRLALDFSDLYGQGFAFEQMHGRIVLGAGKARFDDFVIDGPAGKIMVAGQSDLATQTFDQTVTVEPKLGSSVALASAVAGGPVVGAAVYLVDQVAGNPIDRLGRYRYRVSGPWGEPELNRVGWDPLTGMGGEAPADGSDAKPVPVKERNLFLDVD